MSKYLNSQMKFEIGTVVPAPTPVSGDTFVEFTKVLTSASKSNNDIVDQTTYIGDGAFGSSNVTGKQMIWSFSGDCDSSVDAFLEILDMEDKVGDDTIRNFRVTYPSGRVEVGKATFANINIEGGEGTELASFSFEAHFNGKPTITPAH